MGWVDLELVLVSLAAMLSPTTLTFSVLSLVLADRPLRTGIWFYLGAVHRHDRDRRSRRVRSR